MLRAIFVIAITAYGGMATLRGTFEGLLLYLWIAYFRPESWIYGSWYLDLNISLIVGGVLLVRSVLGKDRFSFDAGTGVLLVIVVHQGLSTYFSAASAYVWLPYENFVKSLVIGFLIVNLVNSAERFRLLLAVISFSLGAEAAKQGWHRLVTSPGSRNDNGIPFLGDNNAVAVGMFMLLPLILGLAETTKRRWERYMWIALAIGVTYRGLSTYSRGGFLTLAVLAVVYIVRSKRYRIRKLALVGATAAVLLSSMGQLYWARMDTISTEEEERDDSANSRVHFWKVAVEMANSEPLFGVGHFAYNYHYDQFDFLNGVYGRGRSVHSSWFGLMAEGGYVGFGLVVIAFCGGFWGCRKLAVRAGPASECHVYARSVQNAMIAFSVGGAFVPMQYNEMLWHLICMGFAAHRLALQTESVAESKPTVVVASLPAGAPPPIVGGIRIPVSAHAAATRVHLPGRPPIGTATPANGHVTPASGTRASSPRPGVQTPTIGGIRATVPANVAAKAPSVGGIRVTPVVKGGNPGKPESRPILSTATMNVSGVAGVKRRVGGLRPTVDSGQDDLA